MQGSSPHLRDQALGWASEARAAGRAEWEEDAVIMETKLPRIQVGGLTLS